MSGAPSGGLAGGTRVLCVGRLYCDLIFTDVPRLPSLGTETFAGGLGLHAGGGAVITAAWLASEGVAAGLAAMLPRAPFREVVLPEIAAAGVDTALCGTLATEADPQVTVAIAGRGDRAFLTRRSGPAAPALTADDLRRAGVAHLHVGELATLVERPELIAVAREAGATVSLDCGWDDALVTARVAPMLARIDVFLPNADEMRALTACGLPERPCPLTVIKRGAEGAVARSPEGSVSAPAAPARAVDTTGAGDAFNAGFLAAWLSGAPLAACLAAGNRLGARAIARPGGFHADACPEGMPEAGRLTGSGVAG